LAAREPSPLVSRVLGVCVRELGIIEVALRLRTTPELVQSWMDGAEMPQKKFLMLVDVLVALDPGWEDWDSA